MPPSDTAVPFRVIDEFTRLAFVMREAPVREANEIPPVNDSEVA